MLRRNPIQGEGFVDVPTSSPAQPGVFLKYSRLVRDPVQGDIRLTRWENAIVDSPHFQRLRHVRQLGMVHLVYPGALHTRFEHSLGTVEEAQRIIDAINSNAGSDKDRVRLDEEQVKLARLCALLHDVSHIPFGHSIEDELGVLDPHDKDDRTIGAALKPFEGLIDRYGEDEGASLIAFDTVVKCLAGKGEGILRAIGEIVSDTISADLLDYLKRDCYYAGLPYRLDTRLPRYFYISRNRKGEYHLTIELDKQGAVRRDNVSEMLYLLRLRYFLGERVYYHPTKIAASTMVSRAVQEVVQSDGRGTLLALDGPLGGFGDDELIRYLADSANPVASLLGRALRDRALFKPCWALLDVRKDLRQEIADCFSKPGPRRDWENNAVRELGGEPGQMLVYCAREGLSFKQAKVHVHTGHSHIGEFGDCPPHFGVAEAIKSLQTDHQNLWCFYVLIDPCLFRSFRGDYAVLQREIERLLENELGFRLEEAHLTNQLPQYKRDRLERLKESPDGQEALPRDMK